MEPGRNFLAKEEPLSRRGLLAAGGLSLLGGSLCRPAAAAVPSPGKARRVLSIFLHGGAATQDMWDLKPQAAAEVRGEFNPIDTNVPGIRISEHLPQLARWMHRAAIVRSVHHQAACHNTLPAFTGQEIMVPEQNQPNPNHAPSMGSVLAYLRQREGAGAASPLPPYVCLPHPLGWGEFGRRPGIYGGFLGHKVDPLCGECSAFYDDGADKQNRARPPELRGQPELPLGTSAPDLPLDRLAARRALLETLDAPGGIAGPRGPAADFRQVQGRAFDLLASRPLRAAFDLAGEDPRRRDRFGRSLFGASVLVASRLLAAGVEFVNVFWDNYAPRLQCQDFGWDTHMYNFITLRESYLPRLDRTVAALLEDLEASGRLDETLILIHSDFGRTPRVNADAGRDHWTYCYSVVFLGGGIRGGTVYGQSDEQAAFVKDLPVSTSDLCATVYAALGINPDTILHDRVGRPQTISQGGRPLRDLL